MKDEEQPQMEEMQQEKDQPQLDDTREKEHEEEDESGNIEVELQEDDINQNEEDDSRPRVSFEFGSNVRRKSVPGYVGDRLLDRRNSSTPSLLGTVFDDEGKTVRFTDRRRSSAFGDMVITIPEEELVLEDENLERVKEMMINELSPDHVPLTQLNSKKQIILPTEFSTLKELAIEHRLQQRDKKIEKWLKRAKGGLASSLSMDRLAHSLSIDGIFNQTRSNHPAWDKFKELCFLGPCWDPLQGKTKLYDVRKEDLIDVQAIIIDLAYALSIYGMTAHRLEYHMTLISSYYGINSTTWCTPTGLWFCFGSMAEDSEVCTYLVPIKSSSLNLSKLCLLDDVAERISRGKMSIKDARTAIKQVIQEQPIYNHYMFTIFSCFLQSGMFSAFFSANLGEMLASFVAGLFIGVLCVIANAFDAYAQINTIVCGIISGCIGVIFKLMLAKVTPISVFIVSLSGVISLLPGLTFTLAIAELSTRHLLSGSARLMSGFVTTIQLGFGVLVSDRLSMFVKTHFEMLPEVPERSPASLPMIAVVIPVVAIGTIISFKAPRYPLAILFIIIDAFAGYFATFYGSMFFGNEVGTVLGAFAVGMIANIFGWISRHPGIVVSACGIIYLVPGSLGYRSVDALFRQDSTRGVAFIFDMLITAVSLTVGLLMADVMAFKRKRLQL